VAERQSESSALLGAASGNRRKYPRFSIRLIFNPIRLGMGEASEKIGFCPHFPLFF